MTTPRDTSLLSLFTFSPDRSSFPHVQGTQPTISQEISQTVPYVFQRLERVKERLYREALHDYLDTPRKTWYVHLTATSLAQHLLEHYRRLTEDAINTVGSETILPTTRQHFRLTKNRKKTRVQLALERALTARVTATLTQSLETNDQDTTWSGMGQRLATEMSAWALEKACGELGADVVMVMPDTELEATLATYIGTKHTETFLETTQHFLTLRAQQAAFDIATTVESQHLSLVELEQVLGLADTGSEASHLQALLQENHLTVLNAAHYHAIREVITKNTFQQHEGVPWPTALLAIGSARGHAQLRPVIVDTKPTLPPEEVETWTQRMWQQREALSDLDADALDALSALWLYQARTPKDDAVADVDELLTLRGLRAKLSGQGRRGGYEPEQRLAMVQSLSHIQSLWVHMTELEVYENTTTPSGAQRRTRTRQAIQSRAFVITDLLGQMQFDGSLDVQKFIFRPGKVFAHFLFGPGRQTALLSAQALTYDPYRQTWEKRLTRYLSYQWRCRSHNGDHMQPYRVATLLDAVGVQANLRDPARTRTRTERTLDTLLADDVIAAWQYARWDEAITKKRGWVQHWLQATILIEPPNAIQEHYQHLAQHEKPPQQTPLASSSLGERLKHQRQRLKLSQIQVAEQLGISPSYLNRLERGQRGKKLSATGQKKIEVWLAAHLEDE